MEPITEATRCYDQMLIVEKYEKVISYLYPIAQSLPRAHGVARNMFLESLLGQVELFIVAGGPCFTRNQLVTRAKRKISNFIKHSEAGNLNRFLASWAGHAKWADTHNLFTWLENKHGLAHY